MSPIKWHEISLRPKMRRLTDAKSLRGIHFFLFLGSLSQRLICICRNILRVLYEKQAFFQIWCLARYCVPGQINNLGLASVFSWPKFLFGSQEAWINTVPPFSFTCVVFSIVKFITSESLSIAWTEESQSNGCMSFAFSLSFSLPVLDGYPRWKNQMSPRTCAPSSTTNRTFLVMFRSV